MSDPVSGAMIVAAVISAATAASAADNQRKIQNRNADQQELDAEGATKRAVIAEEEQRGRARSIIGDQLAIGGETGTDLNGSRADMLRESIYNAEVDALNVRYAGQLEAAGMADKAAMLRADGSQQQSAGYLNAAGTLVRGYGQYNAGKLKGAG